MIGQLIECEADKNNMYYRVIHDEEYRDGRRFSINKEIKNNRSE